MFTKMNQQ